MAGPPGAEAGRVAAGVERERGGDGLRPGDLEIWKAKTQARLAGWRPRMQRAGVSSVYAFVSAAALWPVVEAVRAGEWMTAPAVLGGVLASLGTNLLSNRLQSWQDETGAAQDLQAAVEQEPALRAELDAVLEKLEALALAEGHLSQEDRAWFAETLRAELEHLGSRVVYTVLGDQVLGDKVLGDQVRGDKFAAQQIFITHIYSRETPQEKIIDYETALRRYLDNLIDSHQHLRLQGIRAGSQPLSVALEKVYISLTAVAQQSAPRPEPRAAGRKGATEGELEAYTGALSIPAALQRYRRLVVIGDPGCGKTTLLAYLALSYARALRDEASTVTDRLGLPGESGCLPVLLPLRDLGRHLLEQHPDPSQDGPALLLDYLRAYYQAQSIPLPQDFFAAPLEAGRAVVLLDGMDEVAAPALRQRAARLVEKFAVRYPKNRFVVTSREVGYEGAARVAQGFGLAKVRPFNAGEVRQFVHDWTRAVEVSLAGRESPDILRLADEQSGRLAAAIEANPRLAELAVNPLLLTVVALVHRYRGQLPERRSELYEEAVEVLLGKWDEAKGLESEAPLAGRTLDSGDRRSLLEPIAFWMHERQRREIERDELCDLLLPVFSGLSGGDEPARPRAGEIARAAAKAVEAFLRLVAERSGLLVERGVGVYGFAHLTFQEYLAARCLAGRDDAIEYSLARLGDPWWREALLLQAGYLSTQGKRRASALIRAIVEAPRQNEPEPHHHLLLAAECLADVGEVRVEGDLPGEVRRRLQREAERPFKKGERAQALAKIAATNALSRIESGQFATQFWKAPWGEPQWVTIPDGEFWMGSESKQSDDDERPAHRLRLEAFCLARTPLTNAQYAIFVADQKVKPPQHWPGGQPPKGKENHPVVNVSWHEALAYCNWLGEKIERKVYLPSEAEWEKAARGAQDRREYPWGEAWDALRCNSDELGLGDTTPVGLFLNGASPYRVLDLSGNVWEWTRSLWGSSYPYQPEDGRENLQAGDDKARVVRGGSFFNFPGLVRCSFRSGNVPDGRDDALGFRVAASPI
ncbi:MAG: SUMF1/EgtB/PvdO family nonheme iron enzyme [Chloroflexota bacterium]